MSDQEYLMSEKKKNVIASAKIINGGDLLVSDSLLAYHRQEDGTYDFSSIFKYVSEYVKAADYAVINLETCMGKPGDYCGFPRFRSPDSIIEAARDAGFKMFLTASNHSYDWGVEGVIHKLDCLDKYGVDHIGTRRSMEEPLHKIVDVNGIKIGMLNYTKVSRASRRFRMIMNVAVNRKTGKKEKVIVDRKGRELISLFRENRPKAFGETLKRDVEVLREQGADIIAVYPHWGTEYMIEWDFWQDLNAQLMCDAGVDVIVGSLRGIGYSIMPMIVSLTGACLFRVVWIMTVFAMNPTLDILYLSYPISWALTFGVHMLCYAFAARPKLLQLEKRIAAAADGQSA